MLLLSFVIDTSPMISTSSISSSSSSLGDVFKVKKRANLALNSGEYSLAVDLYSGALSLLLQQFGDESKLGGLRVNQLVAEAHQEACILSKRSVAFFKQGKMFRAHQDALTVIEIEPEWFKGYFRKATVELEIGLYREALKNFQLALRYLNDDNDEKRGNYERFIDQSVRRTISMMARERSLTVSIPWIGAAFGLVVGMALVAWDFITFGPNSYIHHPIPKLMVIGLSSLVFFQLAAWKCHLKEQGKRQVLQPPDQSVACPTPTHNKDKVD